MFYNLTLKFFFILDVGVLDFLELRYQVPWPCNIVITENSINKYNRVSYKMTYMTYMTNISFLFSKFVKILNCFISCVGIFIFNTLKTSWMEFTRSLVEFEKSWAIKTSKFISTTSSTSIVQVSSSFL